MYMHPDMGRLLARAKLEEAQSRTLPARLLRAALLEQEQPPVTPIPTVIDQRPPRSAGVRAKGTTTTNGRPARPVAARPSAARARAQDCHHAAGGSSQSASDRTRAH